MLRNVVLASLEIPYERFSFISCGFLVDLWLMWGLFRRTKSHLLKLEASEGELLAPDTLLNATIPICL